VNTHPFKYLTDPIAATDEAGYSIVDGIIVEPTEACRPYSREYGEMTRWHEPSAAERKAEELRWASLSGPVTIRHLNDRVA